MAVSAWKFRSSLFKGLSLGDVFGENSRRGHKCPKYLVAIGGRPSQRAKYSLSFQSATKGWISAKPKEGIPLPMAKEGSASPQAKLTTHKWGFSLILSPLTRQSFLTKKLSALSTTTSAVYFCCTFPTVTRGWRYQLSCPVKPGLSSRGDLSAWPRATVRRSYTFYYNIIFNICQWFCATFYHF